MRITTGHVLFFAASYACVSTFSRLALDAGANLPTVLVARVVGSMLLLWGALIVMRVGWRLPAKERNWSLAIGLVLAFSNFSITSAFEIIPVPIAILILYTFPFITALMSRALGRERLSGRMCTALLLAFAGLAITVQARIDEYDIRGILFAATAALTISIVVILQTYAFAGGDGRARTLHMLFMASAVMIAYVAFAGIQMPNTTIGYMSLLGMPITYVIGLTGMFIAAIAIGPGRTGLIMNLEPVLATILAALVLDQKLSSVQLAGAAIVVGALFLARKPAKN